jgi:hypothetical protein
MMSKRLIYKSQNIRNVGLATSALPRLLGMFPRMFDGLLSSKNQTVE